MKKKTKKAEIFPQNLENYQSKNSISSLLNIIHVIIKPVYEVN